MTLGFRRWRHAITPVVVVLIDLAAGGIQTAVAAGLDRRDTIAKILITRHPLVTAIALGGIAIAAIVAIFA